ncbi:MAG: T9SS type A sorting domain-containing protein [Bacteroidota bacterium]|nr:T9SS type A sorting domain-containing protein [Bacteroidota bacterium]
MKTILLHLFLFITFIAPAQTWDWVKPTYSPDSIVSNTTLIKNSAGNLLLSIAHSYTSDSNLTELICFDLSGDTLWKKNFPGLLMTDIITDSFDNIYFSGKFSNSLVLDGTPSFSTGGSDAIIGKLDSDGDYIMHTSFGSAGSESATSLAMRNGRFYFTGYAKDPFVFNGNNFGGPAPRSWVIETDSDFNVVNFFQTDSSGTSYPSKIGVAEDGNVYLLGSGDGFIRFDTTSIQIYDDGYYFTKLNESLQTQWAMAIVEHFMYGSYLPSIHFDNNGRIILIHKTGGGGGALHELEVIRYNDYGNQIMAKKIPIIYSGVSDIDTSGNVWVAGIDAWFIGPVFTSIVKVTPLNTVDTIIYDSLITHRVSNILVNSEDDFFITGNCMNGSYLGSYTCYEQGFPFLAHFGNSVPTAIQERAKGGFQLFPNPSTGAFNLQFDKSLTGKVCVYDLLGKCILTEQFSNTSTQQFSISEQAKGIYFVEVQAGEKWYNQKIILN